MTSSERALHATLFVSVLASSVAVCIYAVDQIVLRQDVGLWALFLIAAVVLGTAFLWALAWLPELADQLRAQGQSVARMDNRVDDLRMEGYRDAAARTRMDYRVRRQAVELEGIKSDVAALHQGQAANAMRHDGLAQAVDNLETDVNAQLDTLRDLAGNVGGLADANAEGLTGLRDAYHAHLDRMHAGALTIAEDPDIYRAPDCEVPA